MATKPGPLYVASNMLWRLNLNTSISVSVLSVCRGQFVISQNYLSDSDLYKHNETDHTIIPNRDTSFQTSQASNFLPLFYTNPSMANTCRLAFLFKLSILLMFMVVNVFSARARTETMMVPKADASKMTHVYARKDIPASAPSHRTHSGSIYSRHLLRKNAAGRKRHARGLHSKPSHGH